MGIEAIFHGSVDQHGAFHVEDPEGFRHAKMALRMKRVTITIGEYQEPASEEQRGYYFGVVVAMIAERMSERSRTAVHEFLKKQFLNEIVWVKKMGTTTDQDTKEMLAYIEEIREWAARTMNLDIPDPDKARVQKNKGRKDGDRV